MTPRARVLVVDDSALARKLLAEILASDPALEVVGTAPDPVVAWTKIQSLQPDVLTLDVEMPRMDGLAFLEKLMRARPTPVVMVSTLTEKGAATTLRALELGAFDYVAKPRIDVANGTVLLADQLLGKVKAAARSRPRAAPPPRLARAPLAPLPATTHRLVAIGASTGGTEALHEVLSALPPDSPPIVVVQHMPEAFTRCFAERLDRACRVRVKEARDGDPAIPGHVLVAPGSHHLRVRRSGATFEAALSQEPPVGYHRPSVDVLFESVAREAGPHAVGAILTGMGADGARGLLAMRQAGARTLAQDEASCVVFGMPKEAIAHGAAERVVPLSGMAEAILEAACGPRRGATTAARRPLAR